MRPSNKSNISKSQLLLARMIRQLLDNPKIILEAGWDWLKSDKDHHMYVDIYVENYGLCVEYQGRQHYFYPNRFHKSFEEYKEQLRRDRLKKELIVNRNMRYISWRYDEPLTFEHVAKRLEDAGIPISNDKKERLIKAEQYTAYKQRKDAQKKRSKMRKTSKK
jgi:hypothetical protein